MGALLKLADELRKEAAPVSLGQGQGPIAEQLTDKARKDGSWVVLQNCHLAASWMTTLEKIVEGFTEDNCAPEFRMWCTTYPSPIFPVAVLQNGVKMTMEPPKGLRANLNGSYSMDPIADPDFFESQESTPTEFRRLIFGLCFFHAIVQERRLYGPLGWNIPYEFNESDLRISVQQLRIFLDDNGDGEPMPFKALRYTVGECNYGGRVTDDKDRIMLNTVLNRFYAQEFLEEGHNITPSGIYQVPADGTAQAYTTYIETLPIVAPPEVFGLDDNATLTKDMNETNAMLATIMLTEGGTSGGGDSGKDTVIEEVAVDVLGKLPPEFDMEEAEIKYPVTWSESMNTVLCQELVKYNRLTSIIRASLQTIQKAVKGLVVMSAELDTLGNEAFLGKIPGMWLGKSYGSRKSLAGYFADLIQRLLFFKKWLKTNPPVVFWLSGFFFTHAFTCGAAQNYARKYTIPVDAVVFDQHMLPKDDYKKKPKDGVYTYGLFLEGGRWNKEKFTLDERMPKILFTPAVSQRTPMNNVLSMGQNYVTSNPTAPHSMPPRSAPPRPNPPAVPAPDVDRAADQG